MNLLRQVKTILWSFIGLGRRADMAENDQRGTPLVLVLIASIIVLPLLLALLAHTAGKKSL